MVNKTKQERLEIVLGIARKLKQFPKQTDYVPIDLYNLDCPAMKQLKQVFNDYINSESGFSGKIWFPEIGKTIEYILPNKAHVQPLFVFKGQK